MVLVAERRKVLCGHSFQSVIRRSDVVRIFLSSTFHGQQLFVCFVVNLKINQSLADFIHERNRLFNQAFPELEQWCQERGLHFQVCLHQPMKREILLTVTVIH